ncbi:hypothetical protein MMC26_001635 [Xylographa opegraphella]|nr:hypothetical protein [Xylographa opegraphella]
MVSFNATIITEAVDADFSIEAGNAISPVVEELDSIRTHVTDSLTHVTDSLLSNFELLQSDDLLGSQHDKPIGPSSNKPQHAQLEKSMGPPLNKPEHAQPICREPRTTRSDMPSHHLANLSTQPPRYVGRVDTSIEEQPVFSFGQAPKSTANYGRRVKSNHGHTSVSGSIDVSSEALGTFNNRSDTQKHQNPLHSELPKSFREIAKSQQTSTVSKESSNKDIEAKLADQQTSRTVEDGYKARPNSSIVGIYTEETTDEVGCSEGQRIEDCGYSMLSLPKASQMQPFISMKLPDQEPEARGQSLHGIQTSQPTWPTAASSIASKSYPVSSNILRDISEDRSKVAKIRRKPKNSRPMYGLEPLAQSPVSKTMPTEEDLLQILLHRNQQGKKTRDTAKAVQQARDAELHNIKQAYALLRSQMEGVSKREKAQQIELAKYEKVLPGWKIKARKLEDYLKGLTNDHHKLRDDAHSIQRQQLLLQTDKVTIMTRIEEAHSAFGRHVPGGATDVILEARHHIELLNQQHDAQALRAQKDAELLGVEQKRSQRLEQEISKISSNQQQVIELLHTQRLELMEKLSKTLTTSTAVLASEPSNDQACTWDMLNQCIKMLQEFRTSKHVEPEDMERLNVVLQQLANTSQSASSKQFKLNRHIQKQLDNLKASIKGEQCLSAQILDLREIKASMRERLQACETSLVEARQTIVGLQGREQHLKTDVSALKAEILLLRTQPTEDPTSIDHIQNIESRNSDLENTLARKDEDLSGNEDQIRDMTDEAIEKQKLINGLLSQIDDAKITIQILSKQKAACEQQADLKYEGLRSQLLEASNAERAILADENSVKVEKLQRLKTVADNKAWKAEEEMGRLKAGKEIESKRHEELQAELDSLNLQIHSGDTELLELKEKFRATEENLLAQIQKLEEDKLGLGQRIAETDRLLAANISESQSKNEQYLRRINEVCKIHNKQFDGQVDIDHGIDILDRVLTQAKERPYTPVVNESSGQGFTLQSTYSSGLLKRDVTVCKDGPNDLVHYDSTITAQKHRAGHSDVYASHQSQHEVIVQESQSQSQKTTVHRNLTTTTNCRGSLEDNKRLLLRTPIHRSRNRLGSPDVANMNASYDHTILSSPHWDSTELFPPTPIPASKRSTDRIQAASKGDRPATDKGTRAPEAQSTGSSYGAKTQQPFILPPSGVRRSAADFGMTPQVVPSKRRISGLETVGLGPILPGSQSPSKIQATAKSRKSRRKAPLDKYAVRFYGV